ncbi:porin [Betaproteobacteria bacterium]|nr:porin [Betaproteobacteria bacterium]GHU08473.1 porin [Betaproteobacteria bacterium]GHU16008.1 porin [Betaproteobacteria bacterium]
MKHAACITLASLSLAASHIAHAESGVKIYGTLDIFIGKIQASGDKSKNAADGSGMTTSYFGISGKEDLGNGTKAIFTLETFYNTDLGTIGRFPGDGFLGRNSYAGLQGDAGTLTLGRHSTPYFVSMLLFNPLGASEVFSPMFLHTYTGSNPGLVNLIGFDTAWNNSVMYQSPDFNGLSFSAIYATHEVPGHPGKNSIGGNVLYFNGPFAATFAAQRVTFPGGLAAGTAFPDDPADIPYPGSIYADLTALDDQLAYLAGLSYDLKVVKLFGEYAGTKNDFTHSGTQRSRTAQLGASVSQGRGEVQLSWARTWQGSFAPQGIIRVHRDTATLAYDYPLSKRTDVYVAGSYDKVSTQSKGTTIGLGIRHNF